LGIGNHSENSSYQRTIDKGWRQFFSDKSLQELITLALANNRDLRVTVLNMEQARAQLGIRSAAQLPTVNAVASGSRSPDSDGGYSNSFLAGVSITAYELDFYGRVASLKAQALAQYLATTEASEAAHISLIASVAQSWLNLLADNALLQTAQQTLATREASLKLIDLKLHHGAASELDQRLAQSLAYSARATLAQVQRQRAQDANTLVLLIGQPLPASVQVLANPPASTAAAANQSNPASAVWDAVQFIDTPAGLPSDLLTRRPDIRAAEQLLIASNANIGAARAAFFPNITLTTSLGSGSTQLSGLFKSGSWGMTLSPQLLLPIFDGGRNQANLDSAQAARDIALAQYEKSIQSAFREVSDALAARDTLAQQLQATQALLQAESDRTRLTKLRYDNGAASALDWLDAQRSLFAAQQALVTTRLAYLQNQVVLYKTLGGGLPTPARQP
jgi:multidrug efflux system outer membrane protein